MKYWQVFNDDGVCICPIVACDTANEACNGVAKFLGHVNMAGYEFATDTELIAIEIE